MSKGTAFGQGRHVQQQEILSDITERASDEPDTLPSELTRIRLNYKLNALISFAVFIGMFGLVYLPKSFDLPLAKFVNSFANRSPLLDTIIGDFDIYFTFSGVILIALVWSCWFGASNLEIRARILAGVLISFGAGMVSRFLQHGLPTHPRPFYDSALQFHLPSIYGSSPAPLNTWNSFPSDHVTVFAGLAAVIYLVRPRLGMFAIPWIILVESSRAYMGAHYPSDLIGGAAFAVAAVWASQMPWIISFARRAVEWERSSPSVFYMCGFFVSYQIATLFFDIRSMAARLLPLIHPG